MLNFLFGKKTENIESSTKKEGIVQDFRNYIMGKGFGATSQKDIFTRDILQTHEEKRKCKKAYRGNTFVQKGVNNLKNQIMGRELVFNCRKEDQQKYFTQYYFSNSNLRQELDKGFREAIVTGDGYVIVEEGDIFFKYKNIADSERVYIDFDYKNNRIRKYILEIERHLSMEYPNAKSHSIKTYYGYEYIFGVAYDPEQILRFKIGDDYKGIYGRSPLASALNDLAVLDEIELKTSQIVRNKADPRLLLYVDEEEGSYMSDDEFDNLTKKIEQEYSKGKNPVTRTKMNRVDLSFGGKEISTEQYISYFKRKISIVLTPEFIIHGENVNRSTSNEQKQDYYLEIEALRNPFEADINIHLRRVVSKLNKITGINFIYDFEFKLGDFDFEVFKEKSQRIINEFNMGILTVNEAREQLGYKTIEGLDGFKWEIDKSTPPNQQ